MHEVALYASERAVSGYWYLTASNPSKRWYQQLSFGESYSAPVRAQFSDTGISLDQTSTYGGIGDFHMLSYALCR
jgi:hypothetical protein